MLSQHSTTDYPVDASTFHVLPQREMLYYKSVEFDSGWDPNVLCTGFRVGNISLAVFYCCSPSCLAISYMREIDRLLVDLCGKK
ncbi:hypothetical protein IF1G_04655 [Cordyceps javanica]|uniref:Uncharacterized protein n=1 Tax=Cordyceps javanica TaxID=43265 RepID=A0A545V2Z5_9HYPO|nr:hypothetical protein IF1G_04655 [Cordyceps javanica]